MRCEIIMLGFSIIYIFCNFCMIFMRILNNLFLCFLKFLKNNACRKGDPQFLKNYYSKSTV